jgi:glutaredoxin
MSAPRATRRRGRAAALGLLAALALAIAPPVAGGEAGPFLYTDENGSTHMVRTFDEVPARHRSSVRSLGASATSGGKGVEYQSRVSTMTQERAERARARAKAAAAKIPERRRERVIFYTASWCGVCKYVRGHLKKRGVAYEERSIDDPAVRRELAEKIGGAWVPVVEYEGERVIGYRPDAIDALVSG